MGLGHEKLDVYRLSIGIENKKRKWRHNMDIRFFIDQSTDRPHIENHAVHEDEFVITAYDLTGKPLKAFRKRAKRSL